MSSPFGGGSYGRLSADCMVKVARTTRQTGNLTVILVGGGLFVILAFALTTELFAKNSPSVLYSQAVDMIRDSNAVSRAFALTRALMLCPLTDHSSTCISCLRYHSRIRPTPPRL